MITNLYNPTELIRKQRFLSRMTILRCTVLTLVDALQFRRDVRLDHARDENWAVPERVIRR